MSEYDAIDIHCHYFPKDIFIKLSKKYNKLNFEIKSEEDLINIRIGNIIYSGRVKGGFLNFDRLIKDSSTKYKIFRIISIAPISYFYEIESEVAEELYREFNNLASELSEKYKEHLVFLAGIPLQDPNKAIEELKRAVIDLGLKGIAIGTNVAGKNLDHPSLRKFFIEANRLNVPIFLHPINVAAKSRLKKYYLLNIIGNPLDTTIAAGSLIFSGILDQLHNLKFILAHGGGFFPYQLGRFERGYHVRKETKSKAKNSPKHYLKHFYFDTILHDNKALYFLIQQVGHERIIMGSDYPFDMGYDNPVDFIKHLKLAENIENMILIENARKLFKL
jgi:aminocarboxymuconate-semialdehyde decarboxylase